MKHTFRKYTLALVALLCLLCVVLVGCSLTIEGADGINGVDGANGTDGINGVDGKDGAKWYSGTDVPTIQAEDGDFYIDTDDYILYQMKDGVWSVLIENFGKPGADGQDGIDGINGTNGSDGKDGTNIYIGYDGYIWQDDFRMDFKLDKDDAGKEEVVDDTIGAYTTMKYFEGSFIDLSSKQIALMANYKPNAKITQYSATSVSEIQIVSENAGTLHIGTAKVRNIANARANGASYTANTTSYDVKGGINTISLDLTVGDDETIVIGGSNSTAKIYVVCIPVIDEVGNFSVTDSNRHDELICKTNGYPDTIAIRVRAESMFTSNNTLISWNDHLDVLNKIEDDENLKTELLGNLLKGKQLSVLGDSISTYVGVSNNAQENLSDNAVHYASQMAQADTYWQQIIDEFGMKLCLNNSWSGAYASKHKPNVNADKDSDGSVSSGMARANKLEKGDGTSPDYILVYIGINDLNAGVAADVIASSYTQMLLTMSEAYPYAKVFCLNMPNRNVGNSPIAYNTAIANAIDSVNEARNKQNIFLVDLYNSALCGATYQTYSFDNLHPNAVGMDYMSQVIIDTMKDALGKEFMVSNPIEEEEFVGKKITFLGDSITQGVGSNFTSSSQRYSSVLCSELSAVESNMGISGTVLCTGHESRASRLADVDKIALDSDYVFVMLGTNDFDNAKTGFAELGEKGSTDTSTVYGAMKALCQKLVNRFGETHTKIYLVTPIPVQNSLNSTLKNSNGWSLRDWSQILMETAKEYGLNYIDLNVECEFESSDMANTLHPNTSGTAKIVAVLKAHLLANESFYTPYTVD